MHRNCSLQTFDSPSRGKIERFFRTVREGFLIKIKEAIALEELNELFQRWVRDDYHKSFHQGIRGRPIDRYTASTMSYPRKKIDLNLLNGQFIVGLERR